MSDSSLPDPSVLRSRLAEQYANCSTYRDHGTLVTTYQRGVPNELKSRIWFTTYFKRPKMLRLAYMSRMSDIPGVPDLLHVIWTENGIVKESGVTAQLSSFLMKKETTLGRVLGIGGGVSSSITTRIPSLLLPSEVPYGDRELSNANYDSEESVDGELCDKLRASSALESTEFYLSQARIIILRVVEKRVLSFDNPLPFSDDRKQVNSLSDYVGVFASLVYKGMINKFTPMPLTCETNYNQVVLDEPIPDNWFCEKGRS